MPKILVVEDDTIWQRMIPLQLSGLQGIINTVATGEEAISQFDEAVRLNEPYDACVLDSMFPKKGGDLPDYSAPLEIAREFIIVRKKLSPHRVFVIGSIADFVKEGMDSIGLKNFYFKDKGNRQPYQKHYIHLTADLSQSLRR